MSPLPPQGTIGNRVPLGPPRARVWVRLRYLTLCRYSGTTAPDTKHWISFNGKYEQERRERIFFLLGPLNVRGTVRHAPHAGAYWSGTEDCLGQSASARDKEVNFCTTGYHLPKRFVNYVDTGKLSQGGRGGRNKLEDSDGGSTNKIPHPVLPARLGWRNSDLDARDGRERKVVKAFWRGHFSLALSHSVVSLSVQRPETWICLGFLDRQRTGKTDCSRQPSVFCG